MVLKLGNLGNSFKAPQKPSKPLYLLASTWLPGSE